MARKYLPLTRPGQLKVGTVLVDDQGNHRQVLQVLPSGRVLLSHKNNASIPGKIWHWQTLANFGETIRQNYKMAEGDWL